MAPWTHEELSKIGDAEELQIAGLQQDGTLRKPVIIWVVRHGDGLYVRSVKGTSAGWFRGTQERHEGRIWVGGVEKDVAFVAETDPAINDAIDPIYETKYRHEAQWVPPVLTPTARATTLKLVPR
jgi:hypothetical protein